MSMIPMDRVMERLDRYFESNDTAGAKRHLEYWIAEAKQTGDTRSLITLYNEKMGLHRRCGEGDDAIACAKAALAAAEREGISGTVSEGTVMINCATVYTAFGMLGNGAAGETETQMNAALGLTPEARNAYLAAWIDALVNQPAGEAKFTNADSLWIREDRCKNVSREFLKICGDYYRAGVFSAKMDQGTVSDINNWVDVNTKGMIKKLFDELSPETAMVLMNAISFEAEWSDPFLTDYIRKGADFTHENGTVSKVDLMYGDADGRFLQNSLATGLVKSYKGGKFRYVALLPNEGVTIDQLIASLQPGSLDTLFAEAKSGDVHVAIPRYEEEYTVGLENAMKALGMNDAFNPNLANFSKLFSTPTCISQVLHKTFISVDNKGTKAAAVTAILVTDTAVAEPQPSYNVILNRPFVYMILDENNLPIFLGTYE